MPKYDEDYLDGIGEKKSAHCCGRVRIYLTQWPIKKQFSLTKHTSTLRAHRNAACRIIVYKIKNYLVSLKELHRHDAEMVHYHMT